MTGLDGQVSGAVFRAALLERALNHPGPWSIRFAGSTVAADRTITGNGVVFLAAIPAHGVTAGTAELCCAGSMVSARWVGDVPDRFELEWALELPAPVAA